VSTVDTQAQGERAASKHAAEPSGDPMTAARTPRGSGSAPAAAFVVALLLLLLGIIAVRDFLVEMGWVSGTPWIEGALSHAGILEPEPWMVPIFVVLIMLGTLLALLALRPRPRKAMRMVGDTGVYVRYADLEKLLTKSAEDTDGVESADVSVKSGKIAVRAQTTAGQGEVGTIEHALSQSLEPVISALADRPNLTVKANPYRP